MLFLPPALDASAVLPIPAQFDLCTPMPRFSNQLETCRLRAPDPKNLKSSQSPPQELHAHQSQSSVKLQQRGTHRH